MKKQAILHLGLVVTVTVGASLGTVIGAAVWTFLVRNFSPQQVSSGKDALDIFVNLLTITLAILGLVSAAAWKVLHQEVMAQVDAEISSWDTKNAQTLVRSGVESHLWDSMLNYLEYEHRWLKPIESGNKPYSPMEEDAKFYLNRALLLAQEAERASGELDPDVFRYLTLLCKNALAYHIGTKFLNDGGSPDTFEKAIRLANWVSINAGIDEEYAHNHLETAGWVMMCCGTKGINNQGNSETRERGLQLITEALKRRSVDNEVGWRDKIRKRYEAVFGVDVG
ncbi:MAG: hypothetical protein HW403_1160 [Dehalococcoidia bacterium]|nr:hypothetical protein [Dehalococcoidia bacterium]